MAYRKRKKPYNLQVLESLNNRTKLTKKNYADYLNAVKGYEGECCFDTFTDKLKDCLVLHDLPLKTNGVAYQIDTVLITKETIRLYEVKNYEGEFIYREESLYKINSKLEIINPLYRLTRSKLLFKQLLKELGYGHFSVEAYIVFINPNFTLYEAPHLPNLLLLSNLEQHFKQIDAGLIPLKDDHQLLASKLCAQINPDNLDYNVPEYGYDSLEKGTSCLKCGRFIGKTVDKHYT